MINNALNHARRNVYNQLSALWRTPSVGYTQIEVFQLLDRYYGRKMLINDFTFDECADVVKAIPEIYFKKKIYESK